MAISDQAPYAPTEAVVRVLETYRDTAFGNASIDVGLLGRLSLGDEIARRVIQALRILELIDEDGTPTANLTAFRAASTDTYRELFASLLYEVYEPIFALTGKNLTEKSPVQIEDAFRPYKPTSLRKRMVTLFLGLCQYAGIIEAVPRAKPGPKGGSPKGGPKKPVQHQRREEPGGAKPPPPPSNPSALEDIRAQYVQLLLDQAKEQPTPDVLDRIERALGIAAAKEAES